LNVKKKWTIRHQEQTIKYHKISLEDVLDEDILPVLPKAFSIIDSVKEKGESILVHCVAGKSRSSAVIIGYLMHHSSHTLLEAHNYLLKRRNIALVNNSFMLQLVSFEISKFGQQTMKEGDWPMGNQTNSKHHKIINGENAEQTAGITPKKFKEQ